MVSWICGCETHGYGRLTVFRKGGNIQRYNKNQQMLSIGKNSENNIVIKHEDNIKMISITQLSDAPVIFWLHTLGLPLCWLCNTTFNSDKKKTNQFLPLAWLNQRLLFIASSLEEFLSASQLVIGDAMAMNRLAVSCSGDSGQSSRELSSSILEGVVGVCWGDTGTR